MEYSIFSIFTIAVGLSLDAFGTAVCIGLNNHIRKNNKYLFALSFGFFQFLFSLIGSYLGFWFNTKIAAIPETIGGIIIGIVGIMMLKEGYDNKGECPLIKPSMYIILGVSVSIDAMVVGFTVFHNINNIFIMLKYTIFIGIVTLIASIGAFFISKYLKKINAVYKYADYLGGVILILFGLKMIFL
ncbi:manganese efflux pump MntP [Clostridium prolinivorans]|uniref:manganese efflux pump MntP n=1 Tax=Clostridium prolinivorans TaxID=2769420 RepID=UPI000FDC9D4E|nr:manganese efflux pump [Clostridium prolinivorans]